MSSDRTKPKSTREGLEINFSLLREKGQLYDNITSDWCEEQNFVSHNFLLTLISLSVFACSSWLRAKALGFLFTTTATPLFLQAAFLVLHLNSHNNSNWHSCTDNLRSYYTSFCYMYDFCTNKSRKWIKHSLIYRFKPSRADLVSV